MVPPCAECRFRSNRTSLQSITHVRMAAVRPELQFNIVEESTRGRLNHRQCRKVAVVAPTDVIADVNQGSNKASEGAGFCGEPFANNGELLSSLSPLLFSMKLFGLYFHRQDRRRRPTDDPEWNPVSTTTTDSASTKLRVYATVALILMWLNAVRCVLIFTRDDHFGYLLLMKVTIFNWFCLVAIFQTTAYYACHTGQLLKVLLTLPVTRDCVRGAHRTAVILTAFIWTMLAGFSTAGAVVFFYNDEEFNFFLAPFVTYIYVPEYRIQLAKMVGYLGQLILFPTVMFANSMSQVLVYIFYSQFKKLKKNFRRAVGEGGRFNGDLSLFRRRHK